MSLNLPVTSALSSVFVTVSFSATICIISFIIDLISPTSDLTFAISKFEFSTSLGSTDGSAFGVDNDWSLRIIEQFGNYCESYKNHIADTGSLPNRGPNELWTKGGILYVPPAR